MSSFFSYQFFVRLCVINQKDVVYVSKSGDALARKVIRFQITHQILNNFHPLEVVSRYRDPLVIFV